jgi:hypothetical protein
MIRPACPIESAPFVAIVRGGQTGRRYTRSSAMAQYLLSVLDNVSNHEDPAKPNGFESAEAARESGEEIDRFNEKLKARDYFVYANGLGDPQTATVVDGRGETPILTDGPYIESKEWVAGLWIIDVPDLDVALKLATEGSRACQRKVEVRPMHEGVPEE